MSGDVSLGARGPQPLDMCVELFDLRVEPLAMRPVFSGVNRLSFQRLVLGPKSLDLTAKPLVLDVDVFRLTHD